MMWRLTDLRQWLSERRAAIAERPERKTQQEYDAERRKLDGVWKLIAKTSQGYLDDRALNERAPDDQR